ncbi:MAG: hypothetical protein IPK99_17310 [Flavobacteriales bacterium]|nr:hypothetical protein [Flavobacteriales bacterium]
MTTTERFPDLESVRSHRLALKTERDLRLNDLKAHWENVKDKGYRRALLMDAVTDMLTKDKDDRGRDAQSTLGMLAQGAKLAGGWMPIVGPLLAGRRGLFGSRLFWSGLSMALPILANKGATGAMGELWDAAQRGFRTAKGLFDRSNGVSAERD